MSLHKLFSIRGVAAVFGLLLISAAAYGFAASNVVPETGAGDGAGTISGYTVSAVTYELEGGVDTDPSTIESVAFSLDTTSGNANLPTDVQAQVVTAGTWYLCTTADVSLPASYTCAISPSVTVTSADQLRVVAAE
jgi:hypothetical protein